MPRISRSDQPDGQAPAFPPLSQRLRVPVGTDPAFAESEAFFAAAPPHDRCPCGLSALDFK